MSVLPPPQIPLKAGLERFGVYFTPWAAAFALGAVVFFTQRGAPTAPLLPPSATAPQPQQWTTDAVPHFVGTALIAALPPPDARQRTPPCEPDLEREISGYCWIPVDVKPCPKGKAWEHKGKCYAYALRAAPGRTSGDPRPANVAGGGQ